MSCLSICRRSLCSDAGERPLFLKEHVVCLQSLLWLPVLVLALGKSASALGEGLSVLALLL